LERGKQKLWPAKARDTKGGKNLKENHFVERCMIWSVDALLAVSGDHEHLILVYSPMGIGSSCDCAEYFLMF